MFPVAPQCSGVSADYNAVMFVATLACSLKKFAGEVRKNTWRLMGPSS